MNFQGRKVVNAEFYRNLIMHRNFQIEISPDLEELSDKDLQDKCIKREFLISQNRRA